MKLFSLFETNNQKRQLDLKMMSCGLNKIWLTKIINESPGLYYKNIPISTTKNKIILNLIIIYLRLITKPLRWLHRSGFA